MTTPVTSSAGGATWTANMPNTAGARARSTPTNRPADGCCSTRADGLGRSRVRRG
ncbi:hypothetical protein ACKI1O_17345 [Streptomyces scabiei]